MTLSKETLTEKVGRNIVDAFRKIHKLGAVHGDVRKENILVRKDESVCIIDFERTEVNNVSEEHIVMEGREVEALFLRTRG